MAAFSGKKLFLLLAFLFHFICVNNTGSANNDVNHDPPIHYKVDKPWIIEQDCNKSVTYNQVIFAGNDIIEFEVIVECNLPKKDIFSVDLLMTE